MAAGRKDAPTETMPPPAPAVGGEIVYMLARFEGKVEARLDELRKALGTLTDRVQIVDKRSEATAAIANDAKRTADESNHLREKTDEATRRRFDEGMSAIRSEVQSLQENDLLQNRAIDEGTRATREQNPMIAQLLDESAERKALSAARLEVEKEAAAAADLRKRKLEHLAKLGGVIVIALNIIGWALKYVPHGTP
jgi:hypothetical protein